MAYSIGVAVVLFALIAARRQLREE